MEAEQKQKKILFAGLTILVLAGVFLYSASLLDQNTPVIEPVTDQAGQELTGAAAYTASLPPSYWFLLDQWGYSPPTDHDDTPVQMTVATGTSVPIGAGVNEFAKFDPAQVRITVSGASGERVLATTPQTEAGMNLYVAAYVPEKPGKELVTIEILDTPHKEFVEVSAYDRELLGETRLIREDILWKGGGPSNAETVRPSSGNLEDKQVPWQLDEPGYLRTKFEDELIRTEGELRIYDISALARHRNGEPLPYFYEHILKLEQYLRGSKKLSSDDESKLFSFPPVNAGMRRLDRDQIIRGDYFDGVGYLHAGYFQAYDPAQQPTYIFQGISKDGKFFAYFQQELYSEALREYLRKDEHCFEKDCIEGSFDLLRKDGDLDPSPNQLNALMRSLTIRKQ
ncbi:MAG: hypothetical protein E6Q06_03070 [Candidatus Moraniibacteriota bacterium]|nr:MAG: hypothetical protein E6Q06_03070 [Candidatus Moranbacteria bacterium]